MRVLCVDPSGLLGDLPSPVLYPEYGESFLHVSGLGKTHSDSIREFLHEGQTEEVREVWLLFPPRLEQGQGWDDTCANSLLEYMSEHVEIPVFGIQISWLQPGYDSGQFLDESRKSDELSWFADKKMRTVWLGLVRGDNEELMSADRTKDELLITLALRSWLDRDQLQCSLREQHYRMLIRFEEGKVSETQELLRNKWGMVYAQLGERLLSLQTAHCKGKEYTVEKFSCEPFPSPTHRTQSLYCKFKRHMCIGWFYYDEDREAVKSWVDKLYSELKKAVTDAWNKAENKFREELQRLHDESSQGDAHIKLNPWDAELEYKNELDEILSLSNDTSLRGALIEDIADKQRMVSVVLFEAIRSRPSLMMFMTMVVLVSLGLLGIVFFREFLSMPAATTYQVLPEVWLIGIVIMIILASVWGIWRSQIPVRNGAMEAVKNVDLLWDEARKQHTGYCDVFGLSIRRVVALRNLEIARGEIADRNFEIEQIKYHMNRLAEYCEAFGGDIITVNHSSNHGVDFHPSLPEAENPTYSWSFAGTVVEIIGLINMSSDQCIFTNNRLAGIKEVTFRDVAPYGRSVASSG